MFFEKFTDDDLRPQGITLYEKGEYAVELTKLSYRQSERSPSEMIAVEFAPSARFQNVDGVLVASEVHGSHIFSNFVFIKSDGSLNETGNRMFLQLLSAVTRETSIATLQERFDADTIEAIANKASICATLKFRGYIGQRQEKDLNGNPVMRNTVSSMRALNEEELDALENYAVPTENGIPF